MNSLISIQSSSLKGVIQIPPSKSQTMRSLVFGLLAKGKSVIYNYLEAPDTHAIIQACRYFGASVEVYSDRIEIDGNLKTAENVIHAGNSGQILRFIGAISALTPGYTILTGDSSICSLRLVTPLLEGLRQLGAFAESSRGNGYAPIIIKGPLKGGKAVIQGEDSQPVSGLLIASAFSPYSTELFINNPGESPWVDLTLSWFDRLGIQYDQDGFNAYYLKGNAYVSGFHYRIPGDWSSAAYPLAAAIVTESPLTIQGVDFEDRQGDKEFILLLKEMGAHLSIDSTNQSVTYHPGGRLRGQKVDINRFNDAITLLAVIACFAEGKTEIFNGKITRYKECDRIHAIATELRKMGARIEEREDGLIIESSSLKGACLDTYSDHRMALSLVVAGLAASGTTQIKDSKIMQKTFPDFINQLQKVGAQIE